MSVATKKPAAGRDVFVPIDGFIVDIDGSPINFTTNTRVREGHPILEKYGHLFRRIHVHFDVEDATAEPGKARGE